MPLMINYHKTKAALDKFTDTEVLFVYGDLDPSFKYVPFLQTRYRDRFMIRICEGADHNFRGMIDEYIALADLLIE